jgi:ribosomal-protein-alanine N-acetyltransferase
MQLTTERLILRDFVADDWVAMLAYEVDPLYLRYYHWTERTPEGVKEFVGWFLDQQTDNPRYKFQLAITLKDDGKLIGNCGIRKPAPDAHDASMGYELDPQYWGKGYATEAARAILHFGFTDMRLHRVWAECVADNVGSARVLQKIGMKQEAHFRDHQYYKGRYWDTLIFAMLESDYG